MEITVGTQKSKILTDNPELLNRLRMLYSFQVPGYQYTPAYRRGWDGKKSYISKTGEFRAGLLPLVLKDLEKIDCTPIIKDSLPSISPKDFNFPSIKYYDFQKNLIKRAILSKRGVIKSPTGSGKTLIMAGLIKALHGRKIVVLFNSKQLLKQTFDFFSNLGIEDLGIAFGEGYINGDIMLCTVQSIDKIFDTHLEEAEVLMIDEVHEFCTGTTSLAAIESFPKAVCRFGFTATPPKDDIPYHNLVGAIGGILEEKTTTDLVEEGFLTKPIIQVIKVNHRDAHLSQDMSYREVYDQYLINSDERNEVIRNIVEKVRSKDKNSKILILVKELNHLEKLKDIIPDAYALEGKDSLEERYKVISKFLKEDKGILLATKIMQTGINIEEITHFINARGYKSEIPTLQGLGRSLRKHHSKKTVYCYDFVDAEIKYLNSHSRNRIKSYRNEGHEVIIL